MICLHVELCGTHGAAGDNIHLGEIGGIAWFCRLGRLPQHLHYTKWVMWQNHSEASKSYWSFKSTLVFKQSKVIWKLWYSSGNLKWNNLHSGLKTKIIVEIWTLIQLRWHGLVWVLLIPSAKPPLKEFFQKHAYWKREEFQWRCTVHRTLPNFTWTITAGYWVTTRGLRNPIGGGRFNHFQLSQARTYGLLDQHAGQFVAFATS